MDKPKVREIKVIAENRKARYQYIFIDRYKAGIILSGTEVKAVRYGKVSLSDAYCAFKDDELWIMNLHISEYKQGGIYNHEPKRDRKLLLKRRELRKLQTKVKEKGLTIIPIEVFLSEKNLIKIEISLAKGKSAFNKKESIRQKDQKRDLDRALKDYR